MTRADFNRQLLIQIVLLLSLVFLYSCSPIKAYSGSDLPSNMTSLFKTVRNYSSGINKEFKINGTSIGSSGVVVKPGMVGIEGKLSKGTGKYRNCRCSMTINYHAYSECKKNPNAYCSECSYTSGSEYCEEEHAEYLCRIEYNAVAGGEYTISVDYPSMYVSGSDKSETKIKCEKSNIYWKDIIVSAYISGAVHLMKDGRLCESGC